MRSMVLDLFAGWTWSRTVEYPILGEIQTFSQWFVFPRNLLYQFNFSRVKHNQISFDAFCTLQEWVVPFRSMFHSISCRFTTFLSIFPCLGFLLSILLLLFVFLFFFIFLRICIICIHFTYTRNQNQNNIDRRMNKKNYEHKVEEEKWNDL